MPQQRDPLMWEVQDVVQAGVDLVLRTEPWTGRDQVLHCERMSIVNHTSVGGSVELGLFQGGHYFPLVTLVIAAAGRWTGNWFQFTFLSKWQLYTRFILEQGKCDEGDRCALHAIGYVLEPYTSP